MSAPAHPHASLAPRTGWFKVYRQDVARIREHGTDDHGTSPATLLAVWLALADLANEHASDTFTAGLGLVAYRAAISRRATQYAVTSLERLGMVKRKPNKLHATRHLPSTWTVFPTVPPIANKATPYGTDCHTPMASNEADSLRTSIKKEKKAVAGKTPRHAAAALPQPTKKTIVTNNLPEN